MIKPWIFEFFAAPGELHERFDAAKSSRYFDAYLDLWSRAYANVRYQYSADAALYPDHAYRAEVFQGVGEGWEL